MKKDNIAGIDPSINSLGYCSKRRRAVVKSGKYRGFARLRMMLLTIIEYLKKDKIKFLVIEGYAYGVRSTNYHTTIEFVGILKYWCKAHGIEILIIAPRTLQKFILGRSPRKSNKRLMMEGVCKKWGVDIECFDIADAYGLYKFGRMFYGFELPKYGYEKEIVKSANRNPIFYE